jgi:membrane protein YqaA with SNARE-associated domain
MSVGSLSVLVQGIIDANVMGGISKYQQAFFVPEFSRQHPEFADHVYRLKTLTLDQVRKCGHIHVLFSATVIIH